MRSRNIKPGYFDNEVLGTCDPLIQILFSGLWCMADKAGRLEDRPLKIKAAVFPHRPITAQQIHDFLSYLGQHNLIIRYQAGNKNVIQITYWDEHQRPHHSEKESELPAITGVSGLTVDSPLFAGRNLPGFSDSLIPRFSDSARAPNGETPPNLQLVTSKTEEAPPLSIQNVKAICGHWPPPEAQPMIEKVLGPDPNIERLRLCFIIWRLRGFKATNFDWLLDWYVNGIKNWRPNKKQAAEIKRVAWDVGRHDPDEKPEPVKCTVCYDSGNVLTWPDEKKILDCYREPCPNGCKAPVGTVFGKLPMAKNA